MEKLLLHGCGTALVTPFDKEGNVDYEAFAALVDRQGFAEGAVVAATLADGLGAGVYEFKDIVF